MNRKGRPSIVCGLYVVVMLCAVNVCATADVCSSSFPGGPICVCSATSIVTMEYDCKEKMLKYVPSDVRSEAASLDLSNNKITNVYKGELNHLRHLIVLTIEKNLLHTIEVGSFDGLMRLQLLLLNGNQLTTIERGVFRQLSELEFLHIQMNLLHTIEVGSFDGLMRLKWLLLNGNQLTTIERGVFRHLAELEFLNIQNNLLHTIEVGSFDGLMRLQTLYFNGNQLTTIERGVFRHLAELEVLHIQMNLLHTIEVGSFDGLMRLQTLRLDANQLTTVERGVFRHLASLETLDLTANKIVSINRFAFITLPSISTISLDDNPIECGCDEALLREFYDILATTITVTGGVCSGKSSTDYCEAGVTILGESLFPTSKSCYSCFMVVGISECEDEQSVETCTDSLPVCYNTIEYTDSNQLIVTGGCISLQRCLDKEKANKDLCMSDTGSKICHFCDPDEYSNYFDETNTTTEFYVTLLITLDAQMTSQLEDPNSVEYTSFTSNLKNEVDNYLFQQYGAFRVDFVDLRSPQVTMAFSILCATMSFNTNELVMDAMSKALIYRSFNGQGVITVQVFNLNDEVECPSETLDDPTYGTFVWPLTLPGVSYVKCPHQLSSSTAVAFASRICESYPDTISGRWIAPIVSQCLPADETSRELQNIAQTNVTNDNAEDISTRLNNLASQWQAFESADVDWSVEAITAILETGVATTSHTVIGNTFDTVNKLLFIEENILITSENKFNSSNRLVTAVETLLDRINVKNGNYTDVRDNIAGFVVGVDGSDFDGLGMSYKGAGNAALTDSPISYDIGETTTGDGQSGIVLPSSLLATIPSLQRYNVDRLSISVFRDPKLFTTIAQPNEVKLLPVEGGDTVPAERKINSNVIAANVPTVDIKDLKDPIVVTLHHFHIGENVSCVYWDGVGLRWSADGCSVNLTTDKYTVCHCDHLTNFALLMDVYGSVDSADALALQIISYVGCGLSLIGVILTLVTYLKFRKLRRGNPSRILMNLCLAIGLVDLVFLAGEQEYAAASVVGCKIVAVLLHYFLLSVMCWMAVEAFNMYLALVKVFDTYVARFELKSTLFGWALPIVVVVITLGVNTTDNYGLQSGGICWLGRVPFYAAFLGPVCLLLIVNSIIYVLVIRTIVNRSGNKLTKTDKSSTAVRLRGAISLLFLLGLTWAFALLAVDKFGIVFHYLFAVFNSLQGFFLFVFHCLWQAEARHCWSKALPCLTSPPEKNISTSTYSRGRSSTGASGTTTESTITSNDVRDKPSKSSGKSQRKSTDAREKPSKSSGKSQRKSTGGSSSAASSTTTKSTMTITSNNVREKPSKSLWKSQWKSTGGSSSAASSTTTISTITITCNEKRQSSSFV